ncbi:hypothetical protein IC007_2462 [Sulfuracidifex tepidarius]|uniref:Transposase n=1 Tax=Sulfuracidifex tepidarius TaxID=1294262 RepID=A0A510E655_9CREN|nr:hypothetical protein IC007_2462 [Sulfuracidifex tepidarius]
MIVDGKYMKLRGSKGVLLVALGVTPEGRRAALNVIICRGGGLQGLLVSPH